MFRFYLFLLLLCAAIFTSAQNDFTLLNSPGGGPCLKMAQADNGDLYLLSRGGTLYRSSDHGENWIELLYPGTAFVDFTLLENKIFAIDHKNIYTSQNQGTSFTQTWYFATLWLNIIRTLPNKKMILSGQDINTNSDFPLYISPDEGVNWSLANSNIMSVIPNGVGFSSIFIAPNGEIFVPTFLGEIVSTNEGQTFAVSRSYQYQFSRIAFDANKIYSLTNADFVKSDFQSQNWTNIKTGLPSQNFGGFIATTDAQEIIWLNPQPLSQQVYISTDGGDHWNLQGIIPNFGEEFFNLYSFQNELFLLGSSGVYASSDNGKSWSKKNTGIHAQEYKDIVQAHSKFFFATESGVYSKNYADVNWAQNKLPFVYGDFNYNFPLYIKGMAFYNSKSLILFGSNHYHFIDSLKNNSWATLKDNGSAGGGNAFSIVSKHDTVFSVAQGFPVINELLPHSTTWEPVATNWLNSNSEIFSMVETSDNHFLVVYRNSYANDKLAKVNRSFQLINETPWIDDLQMKRIGSKILDLAYTKFSVSADNGDSWSELLDVPFDINRKLFVDEVGRLFVGLTGKFLMSLDTAKTWTTYTLDNGFNRGVSGITTDSLGYVYVAVNNKGILKSNFKANKTQTLNFAIISPKKLGDSPFSLKATSSSGLSVSYSSSDTLVAKVVGNVVTIFSAGPVVFTATQKGNALYNPVSIQQTFCVSPLTPIISMNKDSQTNKITLTSSSSTGNQWFLNGTKIENTTNQVIDVTQPGTYSLLVTIGGCSSELSDPIEIKVVTQDSPTNSEIRIYPVPAEQDLNIGYSTSEFYTFVVDVIDLQGRTVLSNLEGVDNIKLDVSSLLPSLYFLRVTSANKIEILKFIKR
jgi:photosystem II stability/assembly factor-like uncharacterized protein